MNEKWSTFVFYSLLVFVLISIGFVRFEGKKQDKEFQEDYVQYQQAIEWVKQNKGEQALSLLKPLAKKYPERYNIMRYTGLAYALKNDFKSASTYYQKAIDKRPFLQVDPMFTLQFGQILYFNGEYEKSKAYLEKSKQLPGSEEYHPTIDMLLTSIHQQTKK